MNLTALFDNLTTRFAVLQTKLTSENHVNNLSLNTLLETTALRMLNEVYGYNLTNANLITKNYPAIDGLDENKRIMVQVTKTFSVEKITHTLEQIQKHNLHKKFDKLYFFFLDSTRTLKRQSIDKINRKIPSGLRFDCSRGLLDSNSLFTEVYQTQDVKSAMNLMNILEDVLGFIPSTKTLGFESVALTFGSELDKAYLVTATILSQGYNVYITSKSLYEQFILNKHGFIDYLVLVDSHTSLEHLRFSIVLVSKACVDTELSKETPTCPLLINALRNESTSRIAQISFTGQIDRNRIHNKQLRTWKQVSEKEIDANLKDILGQLLDGHGVLSLGIEETLRELKMIYPNFDFLIRHEDDSQNYSLVELKMEEHPTMRIFYLILAENYTLNEVRDHFRNRFSNLNRDSITVLAPKDPLQRTNNRLSRIKKQLRLNKVYFVADFLFQKTLKKEKQTQLINAENFIDPIIFGKTEENGLEGTTNWISDKGTSPIALLKGPGGIGKTAFCKKLHNLLLADKENDYHIIFLSSSELLTQYQGIDFSEEKEYSVYSLYRKWHEVTPLASDSLISENSFWANFQLGNILVIFDGVDELISTIPSFSLSRFLENANRFRSNIGKGKILINCRDNYFDELKNHSPTLNSSTNTVTSIEVFDLLPFSENLARRYFEKSFDGKQRKVDKCLALLHSFVIPATNSSAFRYSPFIVEIVKLFAERQAEDLEVDYTFSSKILDEDQLLDVIVFRTCSREILKKKELGFSLSVDMQVELFMEVATSISSTLRIEDFPKILININCTDRLDDIATTHLDHPFLKPSDTDSNLLMFRFDFLIPYFKTMKFEKWLFTQEIGREVSETAIKFVAHELEYNSVVTKNILERTKKTETKYFDKIKKLIKGIVHGHRNLTDNAVLKKAISNLFLLLIQVEKKSHKELVEELFVTDSETKIVRGFCLIEVPQQLELIIDFSGLYFTESCFEGFNNLFCCSFDENTFMDESCIVKDCKPIFDSDNPTACSDNFDSYIKGDNSIHQFFQSNGNGKQSEIKKATDSIKVYFKCFYDGSVQKSTKLKREIETNYKYSKGRHKFERVGEVLSGQQIVKMEGEKIKLNKLFRSKVDTFVHQGLNFGELNMCFEKLVNSKEDK